MRPDTIIIDGRAYSWRALLELRRLQIQEWKQACLTQPALFPLQQDYRPNAERSAAARYLEPGLFNNFNQ